MKKQSKLISLYAFLVKSNFKKEAKQVEDIITESPEGEDAELDMEIFEDEKVDYDFSNISNNLPASEYEENYNAVGSKASGRELLSDIVNLGKDKALENLINKFPEFAKMVKSLMTIDFEKFASSNPPWGIGSITAKKLRLRIAVGRRIAKKGLVTDRSRAQIQRDLINEGFQPFESEDFALATLMYVSSEVGRVISEAKALAKEDAEDQKVFSEISEIEDVIGETVELLFQFIDMSKDTSSTEKEIEDVIWQLKAIKESADLRGDMEASNTTHIKIMRQMAYNAMFSTNRAFYHDFRNAIAEACKPVARKVVTENLLKMKRSLDRINQSVFSEISRDEFSEELDYIGMAEEDVVSAFKTILNGVISNLESRKEDFSILISDTVTIDESNTVGFSEIKFPSSDLGLAVDFKSKTSGKDIKPFEINFIRISLTAPLVLSEIISDAYGKDTHDIVNEYISGDRSGVKSLYTGKDDKRFSVKKEKILKAVPKVVGSLFEEELDHTMFNIMIMQGIFSEVKRELFSHISSISPDLVKKYEEMVYNIIGMTTEQPGFGDAFLLGPNSNSYSNQVSGRRQPEGSSFSLAKSALFIRSNIPTVLRMIGQSTTTPRHLEYMTLIPELKSAIQRICSVYLIEKYFNDKNQPNPIEGHTYSGPEKTSETLKYIVENLPLRDASKIFDENAFLIFKILSKARFNEDLKDGLENIFYQGVTDFYGG